MKLDVWFRKGLHPSYPKVTSALELDEGKVALMVIDMQNNFVHSKGTFGSRGIDLSAAQRIIEPISKIATACRGKGIPVIHTRHTFRPDFRDRSTMYFELLYGRHRAMASEAEWAAKQQQAGSLTKDNWNSAFVDELTPVEGDVIIDSKHLFNCFFQTDLELVLRGMGAETLIVTGVSTSVCVETTIRDAFHRGFRCVLVDDCTWEKLPELAEATKTVIGLHFGYLTSSQDVLGALGSA
jgi:ureidoacrylate peracid hydrolase